MDSLFDYMPAMRVTSAVYTRVEAAAPWGIDFNAYHHCKFGIILQGNCLIGVEGSNELITLNTGSCYLLPRGNSFTLRGSPDAELVNFEELLYLLEGRLLRIGGDGEKMIMVGGRFKFAQDSIPPLLNVLPTLLHFNVQPAELQSLQATLHLLADESQNPRLGSQRMIDRIAEIFFLQNLRAYTHADKNHQVGWLGAVADGQIAGALRLIHENSQQSWTIESMAAEVGMSRSVFAQRFKNLVGTAPMEYLTQCRINKASRLLRESNLPLSQIASLSGYESDMSFNRAFKRKLGKSPGQYRREAG